MNRHLTFIKVFSGMVLIGAAFIFFSGVYKDIWSDYLFFIHSVQQGMQSELLDALRRIESDGFAASKMLILLSFLYGVFHAAGPGHGKVVISTYLLSHGGHLRRGIILSFSSALLQGLVAISLVFGATWLLNFSMRQTTLMATDVEVVSYFLVSLAGLTIILLRGQQFIAQSGRPAGTQNTDRHHHCGDHAHHPETSALEADVSLISFLSIIFSTGIRPCSGAVIALLLANSLGLGAAGLAAVFAMSAGTALTVSLLAAFTVYARDYAARVLTSIPDGGRALSGLSSFVGILGGLIIFAFGSSLLASAVLAPSHPFK